MDEESSQFSLSWDHFGKNLQDTWRHLHQSEEFADVTLACDLGQVMAHRIVLSSYSPYLHSILARLRHAPNQPVIFLSNISISNLTKLLAFMYCGEVDVEESQLESFLQAATTLKVKGLVAAEINTHTTDAVTISKKAAHDGIIGNLKKVEPISLDASIGVHLKGAACFESTSEKAIEKDGLTPSLNPKVAKRQKKSRRTPLTGEVSGIAAKVKDENEQATEATEAPKEAVSQSAEDNVPNVPESGDAAGVHVICQCGQRKVVRSVRKESANKGREFFSCPKKLQPCTGSFQWCDEVAQIQKPGTVASSAVEQSGTAGDSLEIKTIEIIDSNGARIAPAKLNLHLQTKFQRLQAGRFQCNDCGKILVSRAKIIVHLEAHLGLSLPCSLCANTYKTRKSLANHYQTKHAASVNPLNM